METVLVTGGFGNLGSNITIELAEQGYEVIAHGINEYTPANIKDLPEETRANISRQTCDLRDTDGIRTIIKSENVDGIVHSAAVLPYNSRAMRLNFEVNADGTLSLLEAAVEAGIDRFVYVGSGSVYEVRAPTEVAYSEEERPIPALDRPYSITKYIGELACEYYRREHGLEAITTRVSRLWGPPGGASGNWAYPMDRLIEAGLAGNDVIREYGGDHPNDYTYHKDAARGIVRAFTVPATRLTQSVYNISGGRHVTVNEISAVCNEEFSDVTFEFGPGYWYELEQSIRPAFDISAARRDLGYDPHPFADSLRKYITYRKTHTD